MSMNPTTMRSAIRLLVHARNSHGEMRAFIRRLIRHDIKLLRAAEARV